MDNREKSTIQKAANTYFNGVVVEQLPVGDFVCGNVCIERKSVQDFAQSVNNGRMNNQALNMVSNYGKRSYIIIIGAINDLYNKYVDWTERRFDYEVAKINAAFPEINIELVPNELRFFKRIKALFKACNNDSKRVNEIKRIAPRSDNKYVDMVRVVDGIGEEKAKAILKQFKVYELWDVSEKDLQSIKGIGSAQAAKIKKVFHR
jgi:ERCC4-type nuclease